MNKLNITLHTLCLCLLLLLAGSLTAQAQATRTWVSGVGDDFNPCSRTAPCKTLAGAISKTATGGEISILDPGGFGALTATKAITVDGTAVAGGVLTSGISGITVNITTNLASDNVILRNLEINGLSAAGGHHGIRFLDGNSLVVEDCKIQNFTGAGVSVTTAANSFTFVRNTVISNCTVAGVSIAATGGVARANLEDVHAFGCTNGFKAVGSSIVTARECSATGCGNSGFQADGTAARLNMRNCMSSNNVNGVEATNGGIVRLSESVLSDSITAGVSKTGVPLGVVESFANNENQNVTPGTASPATPF
jgi:Right handed beta helix region